MKLQLSFKRRTRGMTILEVAIASCLLIMLSGALTQSLMHMRDVTEVGDIDSQLHDDGERALAAIIADLRKSGFATSGANAYPYLFVDGAAVGAFAAHAHAAATKHAKNGDPDFGPNREIVFLQPLMGVDAAGQPCPTLDINGAIQWSANVVSYVSLTAADGRNWLQRRVNALNPQRICSDVERLTFDTVTTDATVPTGAVRVRVFLRRSDGDGFVHRHRSELTINLRN